MLAMVSGVDITPYIIEKTYSILSKDISTEWEDGNYITHRLVVRERISGKFRVGLYGKDGMDTSAFLELWESAVNNHIINMSVFVQNKNKNELIDAYYEIKPISHKVSDLGIAVDVLEISVEER